MTMNEALEERYRMMLLLAYREARHSPDPRTQNGAVITEPLGTKIIARGCNDMPELHMAKYPLRLEAPLKSLWVEHAERAAIYDAANRGVMLDGAWMACCWSACTDCARAIVMTGIHTFVRHKVPEHGNHTKWNDNLKVADEILGEGGVNVIDYEGKLGCAIWFNGELIEV